MTWLFSASEPPQAKAHKVANAPRKDCGPIPKQGVLLGVLKAIECELRERKQLGASSSSSSSGATPLWFLAETERNLYLWLTGVGLANAESTVFWVDISTLINKRRKQLLRHLNSSDSYGFNPFINSDPHLRDMQGGGVHNELSYLDELDRLGGEIFGRAAMISRISDSLHDELTPLGSARKRVVLPFDIKAARRVSQT